MLKVLYFHASLYTYLDAPLEVFVSINAEMDCVMKVHVYQGKY